MFTIPSEEKKLRSRISSYLSALKREKKQHGFIHDGGGKRYSLFCLCFVLNDLKKSREYFEWYKAEFPDYVGDPIQKLCWALSLHRMKEDASARYALADLMLSNLYMIPHLIGLSIQKYDMWHSSNLEDIDYLEYIPEEIRGCIQPSEMVWMSGLFHSFEFRRIRERYIEIFQALQHTKEIEKRKRLLDESRSLLNLLLPPQAAESDSELPDPGKGAVSSSPVKKNVTSQLKAKKIIEKISSDEALQILRILAKSDKQIKKKIVDIAENMIRKVDLDDICGNLFRALDGIDVHRLWDRSGPSMDGYHSPEDMAVEMVEEQLAPFAQELFRLIDLGLSDEAKLYCMGVLKGLYLYQTESRSEFKNWAVDVPGECFGDLLKDWKKRTPNRSDIEEMIDFLKKACPEWANWRI